MILSGLVSVTLREWSPDAILQLAQRAGLAGVEWGGDRHVPHGDLACARAVGQATTAAGLGVVAYGSYYRVGHGADPCAFETVLATALALGAPLIRVWAGRLGSRAADAAHWERVCRDAQRCGELAAQAGLTLSFEFHGGTLTDTPAAARRLLETVAHPAVRCYWQPPQGAGRAEALAGLTAVQPWLSHLHVFHWVPGAQGMLRCPLAEGADDWRAYLRQAAAAGAQRFALLEFVRGDDPRQLAADAATLNGWLAGL